MKMTCEINRTPNNQHCIDKTLNSVTLSFSICSFHFEPVHEILELLHCQETRNKGSDTPAHSCSQARAFAAHINKE